MSAKVTAERIMEMARGYQEPCLLAVAVDLDVFTRLAAKPATAAELAARLECDKRAMAMMLNALASRRLLAFEEGAYRVPPAVADLLSENGSHPELLAMARHQANCMRRWVQLPQIVKRGAPAERVPSIRGAEEDQRSFIQAMHYHSGQVQGPLIEVMRGLSFTHFLDIGGASGTWTIAMLRAKPDIRATLFDLPEVLPLAEARLSAEGLRDRVTLVGGDFYEDELPEGADCAWLGAIVHQNSRQQNRDLFAKIARALEPGGRVVLRDILMEPSHVEPPLGAMFALHMLVATDGGGTFDFEELSADFKAAGFVAPEVLRKGEAMDSLVAARKPA